MKGVSALKKDSFILFTEYRAELELLSDEEAGRLIKAIFAYESGEDTEELTGEARMLFSILRRRLDDNSERYEAECRARKEAGKKGGLASGKARMKQKEANEASASFASEKRSKGKQNEHDTELELDLDLEPETEGQGMKDSCPELPSGASGPAAAPVISLPLNDGSEYAVNMEQCQEWAGLYPAVDVIQQLRNMKGWLLANKKRRKTRRGILGFIMGWLAKEQDRGARAAPVRGKGPLAGGRTYDLAPLDALAELRLPEKL